jgi:D-alanine-D-alanine ligase
MVIKPDFEDGSEGISNASIVNNEQALKKRVRFVTRKWKQAAIAEEYVDGRELYVAILGNHPKLLPICECIFDKNTGGPCLATYRVKWNEKYRKKWNVKYGFAKLGKAATNKIYRICRQVYSLLQLQDYGRIDLRLTADNRVVILEVNANPDVAKGGELAEAAKKAGIPYEKFIEKIIAAAMGRYRRR